MPDRIETLLAHAGYAPDRETGAVVPPIHLATTYERSPEGEPGAYVYSRSGNPTREQFERLMARLEGGGHAFAFASGMAAVSAVFQLLSPGAHIILPDDLYYGVRQLLSQIYAKWKVTATFVNAADPNEVKAAIRDHTAMIWLETPSNPMLRISDIARISGIARERGIMTAVDGTWTTPLLQRPLDMGADIVVHSVTKYLAGHSDVLGGVVVVAADSPYAEELRIIQTTGGAVLDPFSSWMAMRGIRTLALRIRQQCENAASIAAFLTTHPRVSTVHYPGLPTHPGHETAARQMKRPGGMLSFEVDGSADEARRVAGSCRVIRQATSLGGTETLIEHRASVEKNSTAPPALLRLSAGIENIDDLLEDLSRSLSG